MSRARDDDAEVNVPLLARNSLDHPYTDDAPPYSPPDPLLHDLLFRRHPLNNHAAAQDPPYLRVPFFNKFVRLPSFFRPYSTITQSQRFYRFQTALGRRRGIIVCLLIFALLLLLVSLYFTVLFNPPPLPSPIYPDITTTTSARFLTLNIFMRPPGIRNNLSDYKDSRLEYLIRYVLPRYDVVALQEAFAFGTIRKDILIREARKLGFNYHLESKRKDIFDLSIDGGLLVLSRFKIVDSAVMEYERGAHNDWLAAKGALHARLELNPSTHLDLFTTHTQASYGPLSPSLTDSTVQVRLRQLSHLHDFIALRAGLTTGASSPIIPILLAGDLNVDASQHIPPPTQPSSDASEEYEAMMKVLRGDGIEDLPASERRIPLLVDSVREQLGYHPVTYGDVQLGWDGVSIEPAETVLTAMIDQGTVQSLDRVLFCEAAEVEGEAEGLGMQVVEGEVRQERYRVRITETAVEKFLVKDEKDVADILPFTQVSDHYGISAVIELSPV